MIRNAALPNSAARHAGDLFVPSLAHCTDYHGQAMGWGCIEPWCPRHDPESYAVEAATHRADVRTDSLPRGAECSRPNRETAHCVGVCPRHDPITYADSMARYATDSIR